MPAERDMNWSGYRTHVAAPKTKGLRSVVVSTELFNGALCFEELARVEFGSIAFPVHYGPPSCPTLSLCFPGLPSV